MSEMHVSPVTLIHLLEVLSKRVRKAKVWVGKHKTSFAIEVPDHLAPTIGPKDGRCLAPFAPVDDADDQAIVEVLWLVLDAMEPSKPVRRRAAKRPTVRKRR
ncbi:MAG: hypothetical protein IPL89_12940 [Acidobacteria bacterium]|nr:hypothetical protein [Acidobacteriota bacterium]